MGSSEVNHNDNAYAGSDEEGGDNHKHNYHRIGRRNKKEITSINDEREGEAGDWNKADGILRVFSKEEDEEEAPSTLETTLWDYLTQPAQLTAQTVPSRPLDPAYPLTNQAVHLSIHYCINTPSFPPST